MLHSICASLSTKVVNLAQTKQNVTECSTPSPCELYAKSRCRQLTLNPKLGMQSAMFPQPNTVQMASRSHPNSQLHFKSQNLQNAQYHTHVQYVIHDKSVATTKTINPNIKPRLGIQSACSHLHIVARNIF